MRSIYLSKGGILSQSLFIESNCVYIIQGTYTALTTIKIPQNSKLFFEGGEILSQQDGRLELYNTTFMGEVACFCPCSGIGCNKSLKSSWFCRDNDNFNTSIFDSFSSSKEFIVDNPISFSNTHTPQHINIPTYTRVYPCGRITLSDEKTITFNGFEAGLYHCLSGEGLFRFRHTIAILPQWFGECGDKKINSTNALQKAFRACRNSIGDKDSDNKYGCSKIYLPRGVYLCNNVDVYANCQVEGELAMATNGSMIVQDDHKSPALRIHCKNYNFDNFPDNRGNGIGSFTKVVFRSKSHASKEIAEPIIDFLSPSKSTSQFGYDNDGSEGSGFTDFNFEYCWFQFSYNACINVCHTYLDLQLINCTFDVVTRGITFGEGASGVVRCLNTQFFYCVWGAILISPPSSIPSSSIEELSFYIRNSWFRGCGAPSSPSPTQRYSLAFLNDKNKKITLTIEDCVFEPCHMPISQENYGGSLCLNVETLSIRNSLFKKIDNIVDYYRNLSIFSNNIQIVSNIFLIKKYEYGKLDHIRIIGLLKQLSSHDHCILITNNIFQIPPDEKDIEALIHSDYPIQDIVIANNIILGKTKLANNNISLSGNIVSLNSGINSNTITAPSISLAPTFKKGDLIFNSAPQYFVGWLCQEAINGVPHWIPFGAATYSEKITYGTSGRRPTLEIGKMIGHCFFDQTLQQPLWWDGQHWRTAEGTLIE